MFKETLLKIGRKYKKDELLQLALDNIDSKKETLTNYSNRINNLTKKNKALILKNAELEAKIEQLEIDKDNFKRIHKKNYNVSDKVYQKLLKQRDSLESANKVLKNQLFSKATTLL